jgi:hypothetical protein
VWLTFPLMLNWQELRQQVMHFSQQIFASFLKLMLHNKPDL